MDAAFNREKWRSALSDAYLLDDGTAIKGLLNALSLSPDDRRAIKSMAIDLTTQLRRRVGRGSVLDQLMHRYPLWSDEGMGMMTLAEAFLRIPDPSTQLALLQDKLGQGDFVRDFDRDLPLWMKGLSRGLALLSHVVGGDEGRQGKRLPAFGTAWTLQTMGPIVQRLMKTMATHFVMATDCPSAIRHGGRNRALGYTYSFDMLGEAALSHQDAERYLEAYRSAIRSVGDFNRTQADPGRHDSVSIKLSALYPRYEASQEQRVITELAPRLLDLVTDAIDHNVPLTIDGEESHRLDLSLGLLEHLLAHKDVASWGRLGMAVQAYQKRVATTIDFLGDMARHYQTRLFVRLVKGAYWDSEIKNAQEKGLSNYPVFTRKEGTDLSYLVCAEKLFDHSPSLYPQFATHNGATVCAVAHMARGRPYECQKLHGMGDDLYAIALGQQLIPSCRIYAPIGAHHDLLPYLVRRLLENGSNTSFVRHVSDAKRDIQAICADPVDQLQTITQGNNGQYAHPQIPLPKDLYGRDRPNAATCHLADTVLWRRVENQVRAPILRAAYPLLAGRDGHPVHAKVGGGNDSLSKGQAARSCVAPHDPSLSLGTVIEATSADAHKAFDALYDYVATWQGYTPQHRADILFKMADLLERDLVPLMGLLMHEGGKTAPDALAEVREAIDFCRYYGVEGVKLFSEPTPLPGPVGEDNHLFLKGRGVFVCISPWNFPLAIFLGQIVAALMAGNTVLAKPARQTPLIAFKAIELLREAGLPAAAIAFLPGSGAALLTELFQDNRLGGVCLTGSTETARHIQQALGQRSGPIVPFIAETGGQNVMVVDSSALPEQVVGDVIVSAFHSAGQRCSALRVLCLQEDIAPRVLDLLKGAMATLHVGSPILRHTDIGPVIDGAAAQSLRAYCRDLEDKGCLLAKTPLAADVPVDGTFVPPHAFEIADFSCLGPEVFGPVLHILRFPANGFEDLLRQVNTLGYGLTFGLHSRITSRIHMARRLVNAGNLYVNRTMIGAVVGVQPFGGMGLSGTGPKAGGPHYLSRFAVEQTVTVNTAACGGNGVLTLLD